MDTMKTINKIRARLLIASHSWNEIKKLGDAALEPLNTALKGKNWYTRKNAARVLEEMGWQPEGMAERAWFLVASQQWEEISKLGEGVVEPLIATLALSVHPKDQFASALKDEGPNSARRRAAKLLGEIGDQRAVSSLIAALTDKDVFLRRAAASALGEIGDRRAAGPLLVCLERIGKPALEPLTAALKDGEEYGRYRIPAALERIDPNWPKSQAAKKQVPDFIKRLGCQDWRVQANAALILGKIKDKLAVEALSTALGDENTIVRYRAAETLGIIRDRRAVESLIAVLQDEDEDVIRKAAWALGEIRDAQAVKPLKKLIKKNPFPVAKEALEQIEKKVKGALKN